MATNWENQTVGKLTVIGKTESTVSNKPGEIFWIARCECGSKKTISSRSLRDARRRGSMASCGCASGEKRRKDWSNVKVGRLTLKSLVGTKHYPGGQTSPLWSGVCDCGNERKISSVEIRTAITQKTNLSCEICPKASALDLVGQRIGMIRVGQPVGKYEFPNGNVSPTFSCECDCGNTRELNSVTLRGAILDDYNLSCGCKIKERRQQHLGKKIGRLSILDRSDASAIYICLCDCGKKCSKTTYELSRAEATNAEISCGCYYSKIEIGDKFERLTVIRKMPSKKRNDGNGARGQWKCQCECGNQIIAESTNLTKGKVKSCGCFYRDGDFRFSLPFCYLKKECPRCKKDLERADFGTSKSRPGGLRGICSKCSYEVKDYSKVIVSNILREERTKRATPPWVKKSELAKIHAKRIELEERVEKKLNVDHIVPLVHSDFCGLNIPQNLQITSSTYNLSKGNKFDETDLFEIYEKTHIEDGVRIHSSIFEDE